MSAYKHHGTCSISDPCLRCFEFGRSTMKRQIIALIKDASAYERLKNNGEPTAMLDATISLIEEVIP